MGTKLMDRPERWWESLFLSDSYSASWTEQDRLILFEVLNGEVQLGAEIKERCLTDYLTILQQQGCSPVTRLHLMRMRLVEINSEGD